MTQMDTDGEVKPIPDLHAATDECRSFAASARANAARTTVMSMEVLPHLLLTPGRSVSKLTEQFMLCDGRTWAEGRWKGDVPPGLVATVFRTWRRCDRSRPMHLAIVGSTGIASEIACADLSGADRVLYVDGGPSLHIQLERSAMLGQPKRYVVRGADTRDVYSMPMIDHLTRVRVEQNGQWLLTGQVQSRENALAILIILARVVSFGRVFRGYPLRVYGLIDQVGPLQLTQMQQWQVVTLLVMMRVTEFYRGVHDE